MEQGSVEHRGSLSLSGPQKPPSLLPFMGSRGPQARLGQESRLNQKVNVPLKVYKRNIHERQKREPERLGMAPPCVTSAPTSLFHL